MGLMGVEFKDPQKSPYCIPNRAEGVDVRSRRDLAGIALILSCSETPSSIACVERFSHSQCQFRASPRVCNALVAGGSVWGRMSIRSVGAEWAQKARKVLYVCVIICEEALESQSQC